MTHIELYDTTLRDGMQGEGMSLSAEEKLRVAHRLDELGIDLIEAGFPSSNPKELELFELLARETFATAEIAAFGMTRRRDLKADEVFLTGTAAELVPVREIDDHAIGTGRPGPVTTELQRVFDDALHGRDARYAEWLDLVAVPPKAA